MSYTYRLMLPPGEREFSEFMMYAIGRRVSEYRVIGNSAFITLDISAPETAKPIPAVPEKASSTTPWASPDFAAAMRRGLSAAAEFERVHGMTPSEYRDRESALRRTDRDAWQRQYAGKFSPDVLASLIRTKTLTPILTDREFSAKKACAPGGAFDHATVVLGRSISIGERLERLEAAVLAIASNDPGGPIKSIRDFLSYKVSESLRKALVHFPAEKRP